MILELINRTWLWLGLGDFGTNGLGQGLTISISSIFVKFDRPPSFLFGAPKIMTSNIISPTTVHAEPESSFTVHIRYLPILISRPHRAYCCWTDPYTFSLVDYDVKQTIIHHSRVQTSSLFAAQICSVTLYHQAIKLYSKNKEL